MKIEYGDTAAKAQIGDTVQLKNQSQEVVKCQQTGVPMLNIDANQLAPGDLKFIKKLGLTISNPDTDKPVALGVDFKPESWGHKIKDYFESKSSSDDEDDSSDSDSDEDDDSSFFGSNGSFLGGTSSWGSTSVNSGGGFGGFGGGGFSGGGASSSF